MLKAFIVFSVAFILQSAEAKCEATSSECDRLAAHPRDAGRENPGVSFDNIQKAAALAACKKEVDSYLPSSRPVTLNFEYGRVLQANGLLYDAAFAYKLAMEQGHPIAPGSLLTLLWKGEVAESAEYNVTISSILEIIEKESVANPQFAYEAFNAAEATDRANDQRYFIQKCVRAQYPDCLADYGKILYNGDLGFARDMPSGIRYINQAVSLGSDYGKTLQKELVGMRARDAMRELFFGSGGGGGSRDAQQRGQDALEWQHQRDLDRKNGALGAE